MLRLCEAYFERLDLQSRATLLHNLGMCALEFGDPEEAEHRFSRSAVLLEQLGYRVWSAKSRYWSAKAMVVAARYGEAIPVLEQSWRELETLGATGDAVLPALLLVEAFLIVGRKNEVPAICRKLLERCTQESMPKNATTALAFLREAVANGNASPTLVRDIHDYMRDSARKAARFAS